MEVTLSQDVIYAAILAAAAACAGAFPVSPSTSRFASAVLLGAGGFLLGLFIFHSTDSSHDAVRWLLGYAAAYCVIAYNYRMQSEEHERIGTLGMTMFLAGYYVKYAPAPLHIYILAATAFFWFLFLYRIEPKPSTRSLVVKLVLIFGFVMFYAIFG
jgi:hypothetical protein